MKNIIYVERKQQKLSKKKIDSFKQPMVKKNKRRSKKIYTLSIVSIVIIMIFFISYSFGFIPLGLSAIEPIGNVKVVNADELIDEFPSMADMPNLDKIEYEAYDTDAPLNSIVESYQDKLINEGYNLKYSGTVELDGITFNVYGYLKGFTAVGILATDEIDEEYESLIFYATGNALDFREILDWYKNN